MADRSPLIQRLRRDRSGASAVEFALIAPILIGLYFGMAEYCQAMLADRKATHVASAVGDLVSQSDSVTVTDLDQMLAIGATLMTPFKTGSGTPLKIRVTLVSKDASGTVSKPWTRASTSAPPLYDVTTLPATGASSGQPFLANGQSIIVSQAEYTYTSPFNLSLVKKLLNKSSTTGAASTYTFKETFYLRPRRGGTIPCTGCSAG
jgi:Flp pilus assembly protein TadG